jgi:transposase InsO family protein
VKRVNRHYRDLFPDGKEIDGGASEVTRAQDTRGPAAEGRGVYDRPGAIRVDNGPELTAQVFVDWCAQQAIEVRYIQPGKPDQNAYIERFNRSYREEVLSAYVFESLEQVRALTDE